MVNPFLSGEHYDTETAIMLENATILDIENAVAYTDGAKIFMNTPDNLYKLLPAYNDDMLKWLLWHERMHIELNHHKRYFKCLADDKLLSKLSKEEVNIIMDILVHDWMAKKFPELVPVAKENLAQFRDCNSLGYTFKTKTLTKMLTEYAESKEKSCEEETSAGKPSDDDRTEQTEPKESDTTDTESKKKKKATKEATKGTPSGRESDIDDDSSEESIKSEPTPDWSQLDNINPKEFITESEAKNCSYIAKRLAEKKIRIARLTQTMNGLTTSTRIRSYKTPNYAQTGQHTILKGSKPGHAKLYLCFDASGSMSSDMYLFKTIIKNSIPQALSTPTLWFAGVCRNSEKLRDPDGRSGDYFKGTFKDFLDVLADDGYSDDGDRTIELCWRAEQLGYSPIGITDGGGQLKWSIDKLKELKSTILVGSNSYWLNKAHSINPNVQILCTRE